MDKCFNCHQKQTTLVKLTEREESDKTPVVAPNLTKIQICENLKCFSCIDLSKVKTWKKE